MKEENVEYAAEQKQTSATADLVEFDALDSLLRLATGASVEGSDILLKGLARCETLLHEQVEMIGPPSEASVDRLRYALIGLMIEGTTGARRTVNTSVGFVNRLFSFATDVTAPISQSWLMRPVRRPIEELVEQGRLTLTRLQHQGYMTETEGRRLARTLTDEAFDELIHALAHDPDVRILVEQQTVGLMTDMTNGIRDQSVNADALVEGVLRRLLGRPPRSELPPPPPSVQAMANSHHHEEQDAPDIVIVDHE